MKGGDSQRDWKLFYLPSRNANLAGLAIGLAVGLYILSNSIVYPRIVQNSEFLAILFAIGSIVVYSKRRNFIAGMLFAGLLTSAALFFESTRSFIQILIGWQFVGILEFLLLIGGVLLEMRSY
jgi:hypothetical protein